MIGLELLQLPEQCVVRHVLDLQVYGRDDVLAVYGLDLVVVVQGLPLALGDLLLEPLALLPAQVLVEAAFDPHSSAVVVVAHGTLGHLADRVFPYGSLLHDEPAPVGAQVEYGKGLQSLILRIAQVSYDEEIAVLVGARLTDLGLVVAGVLAEHLRKRVAQPLDAALEILV